MSMLDSGVLKQIRESLLEKRRRIVVKSVRVADLEEPISDMAEVIDVAQSLEQMDREKSLAEQERRDLVAIERALTKIGSDGFGICEDCDEAIPPRRLLAVPEARLCAKCQSFEERQQGRARGLTAVAR